jgi:hypothetical protein
MKRVMILLFGGALVSGIAAYAAMAKSEPRASVDNNLPAAAPGSAD